MLAVSTPEKCRVNMQCSHHNVITPGSCGERLNLTNAEGSQMQPNSR